MLAANLLERRIARMETSSTYDEEGAALEKKVKYMQEDYDNRVKCAQNLSQMIEQFLVRGIPQFELRPFRARNGC